MKNLKTSKLEIEVVPKHIASWMNSVDCSPLSVDHKQQKTRSRINFELKKVPTIMLFRIHEFSLLSVE